MKKLYPSLRETLLHPKRTNINQLGASIVGPWVVRALALTIVIWVSHRWNFSKNGAGAPLNPGFGRLTTSWDSIHHFKSSLIISPVRAKTIIFTSLFSFILICLILSGCNNTTNDSESTNSLPEKITIATAANMQFAMKEMTQEFTSESGILCVLAIGSSGNLTAQISEGAPYDIFVAANMVYPKTLFDNGLAEAPPAVYASGRLVLWTMLDDMTPSLDKLTSDQIKHIAIANPKIAPYGLAAIQVLQHNGLLERVRHKLVYGESIAQTNQFITSKSAEIGFTALSVVLSPNIKNKGQWAELDPKTYSPIDQGVIIIKQEHNAPSIHNSKASQKFYEFLFSAKAKKILKDFGYWINE